MNECNICREKSNQTIFFSRTQMGRKTKVTVKPINRGVGSNYEKVDFHKNTQSQSSKVLL